MKGFGSERWKTSFRYISSGLGLNYWLFLLNIAYFVGQICNAIESKTSIIEQSSLEETMCKNASECNFIHGPVTCQHNLCVCKHNYVFNKHKNKCLPRKALGELCEISEQCNMSDPFSYCYTLAALDPKPVNCRCRAGYQEVGAEGENKKCKKVLYNSGGSFFDGISPYDARDLVPIIMGCLAAGLALCFCCVGIVQLMRRKRSLQWRTECEIPQEFLFAGSDVTHYVTTNTTGLPGPETLTDLNDFENEERYQIVDLPPSYEATIIPPSYEEAMKRVKASESNL